MNQINLIVSKTDPTAFSTIQGAIDSIPPNNTTPITLSIRPGIYKEKLTINRPYLTLIGEDPATTVLTYQDYAKMPMPDGSKCGTFRSYSCFIDANDITLKNLTLENSSGSGRIAGQALALYADGDRILLENCRLLGHQDTLFTGPLPPSAIQQNGFIGPKEHADRINGRHCYKNCTIYGDVDFIFGSATAYFEHCTIHSLEDSGRSDSKYGGNRGYITAASTPEGQPYGYVFFQCHFTSDCPPHSVYLGRPWRNYTKTVLLECNLEEHIKEEGWHDWNKEEAHTQTFYAEYRSFGPGAAPEKRVPWSHQLSESEAALYTKEKVLDGWNI